MTTTSGPLTESAEIPGFRSVPRTGVIYVMHRAEQLGFQAERERWANLGQGAPECGSLPGAPPRREQVLIPPSHHEYAPIGGIRELRQKVADLYNTIYRRDRASQYGPENVSIAPGGRAAMTRIAAAMGEVNMGHFIPDYTAYEELLTTFKGFVPIPILLSAKSGYRIGVDELRREIVGRGLSSILCSNPCNPTGRLVEGEELAHWVEISRDTRCTLILDEFYSHYIYSGEDPEAARMVSSAAFIDDVEQDPVLIIDGLTKNWRYPGWRISWILGPSEVIAQVESAGSYLDGGANHPFQREALVLVEPELALQETRAIQREFLAKRRFMIDGLRQLGIEVELEPQGAFYVWGSLRNLPSPLDDGMSFFEEGLLERVITVPGTFFDVNPGRRRALGRYQSHARFSFGPALPELERGLAAIERLIRRHR